MLLFVLRKMVSNRWMVASLLVGVILAVTMVTTIPIYSRAILTRLLVRDLQSYQETTGAYPGLVEVSGYVPVDLDSDAPLAGYDELSGIVALQVDRGLPVPVTLESVRFQQSYIRARRADQPEAARIVAPLAAVGGFLERVEPVIGRLPRGLDGVAAMEAVITEETAAGGRLVYGASYELVSPSDGSGVGMQVRIVGVVRPSDLSDAYWTLPTYRNTDVLHARAEVVREAITAYPYWPVVEATWSFLFDYQAMSSEQAAPLVRFAEDQEVAARRQGLLVRVPILRILRDYAQRERVLKLTLWVLQVPLLLMLAFYLFMVSQVLIDHERNEIAVLKSRGADAWQVFATYLVLGSLLAAAGVAAGPFIGMLLCRVLGASSGFLEFVRRRALRLELTPQVYLYAAAAAALALLTMLLPAVRASRATIVHHKQQLVRASRRPVWQVFYLDLVALGVSSYGVYRYRERAEIIRIADLAGVDLALDPMLLFVSTLFVLGLGLLFLRVYPFVVRLVFRLGKRRWPPSVFSSLIQAGRAGGKDQFLMLFIILSISIGVFNADTARTLNRNTEEQLRYRHGAEIVIREEWQRLPVMGADPGGAGPDPGMMGVQEQPGGAWVEPAFRRFRELPGVLTATRVYRQQNAQLRRLAGGTHPNVTVLGVVPHEFGRVAWLRDGLLSHHWFEYLNLMSHSPAAALVSSSLRDAGLNVGDAIFIQWRDQPATVFYVYGFVDYWPSFNPLARRGGGVGHLAVVNLDYLQAMTALEPYDVWMSIEPGTETQTFYDAIRAAGVRPVSFIDVRQEIVRARNDPLLQGTNGTLSLGFIVSLGVCFVGFLIYWVFSIRERTLQFGLFRAMGMGRSSIVTMLALEQLLISGVAVCAGFAVGSLTSRLFAPLLQVASRAEDTVPPFRVVSLAADQLRIGGFVLFMLLLGFVVLAVYLNRIRIHQAVKLGEE